LLCAAAGISADGIADRIEIDTLDNPHERRPPPAHAVIRDRGQRASPSSEGAGACDRNSADMARAFLSVTTRRLVYDQDQAGRSSSSIDRVREYRLRNRGSEAKREAREG